MKKGNRNVFTLGLDGLDITINTNIKLEQNQYVFKKQTGEELGNLVAVKNGYKLHICLPKVIRNNNTKPFGVSDYKQLNNVLEFIKNNVLNLFKGESTEITVQACEVNSTVVLSKKEQTTPMLKLLSHVLLTKDEKLFIACSGEQIGKRYKEKAFNTETRLRANTYILDHAYGKDYTVFKQEQEQSDTEMKIKLNIVNNTSDSESWNDDTSELDNWGEDDIYK